MIDRDLLKQVVAATKEGKFVHTSPTAHQPMVALGLVEVNDEYKDANDPTKIATRSTAAAEAYLAQPEASTGGDKSKFEIITGAVLPAAKRRGNPAIGGTGSKYPFADLPVGGSFFSPNSDHKKGDAVKGLGSTVSAQNDKYAEQKVENGVPVTKKVTRAVRDPQTKKAVMVDGKKVTETVDLPVKVYARKFTIRPVEAGKAYGQWVAPSDGALVARTV